LQQIDKSRIFSLLLENNWRTAMLLSKMRRWGESELGGLVVLALIGVAIWYFFLRTPSGGNRLNPPNPVVVEWGRVPNGLLGDPIVSIKIRNNGGAGMVRAVITEEDGHTWNSAVHFNEHEERVITFSCPGGSAWWNSARCQVEAVTE
jgi:hypothetical protein